VIKLCEFYDWSKLISFEKTGIRILLKIASYSLALLSLLALSGCGSSGDGGDGASSTTPDLVVGDTELLGPVSGAQLPAGSGIGSGTAPNTRSDVSDTEYLRNDVYDSVRLYKALQWGIKGAGVKIAVLDSGIDADHPDIASNLDTVNSGSAIGSVTFGSDYEDNDGHGTNSAGSAVGNDNGSGIQGAAPEATLIAIKVTDTGSLSEANQIRGMDMARTAGADIVNISFGLSGFENESLEDALDSGAMTQDLSLIVLAMLKTILF